MGMARSVLALDRHGRDRALYPPRHPRNTCFRATSRRAPYRAHARIRSDKTAAKADHPDRAGADGGARPVLCLCCVPVHLWDNGAPQFTRPAAERIADGDCAVGGYNPAVRVHLRPYRTQADVPDRRGHNRCVRVHLFRDDEYRDSRLDFPRRRAVLYPARYDVWSTSRADRRMLYAAAPLQRLLAWLPSLFGHRRWPRTIDRDSALRGDWVGLCYRALHPVHRDRQRYGRVFSAGLH